MCTMSCATADKLTMNPDNTTNKQKWKDLNVSLSDSVVKTLKELKFRLPTPIQVKQL